MQRLLANVKARKSRVSLRSMHRRVRGGRDPTSPHTHTAPHLSVLAKVLLSSVRPGLGPPAAAPPTAGGGRCTKIPTPPELLDTCRRVVLLVRGDTARAVCAGGHRPACLGGLDGPAGGFG